MPQPTIDPDEAQKITIESYNQHISEYLDKRRRQGNRTMAYWPGIEYFLHQLQPGQTIFEIGSGSGTDATTIEEFGYIVKRSDVTGQSQTPPLTLTPSSAMLVAYKQKQEALYATASLQSLYHHH
jgi:hypothetical protein